MSMNIPQLHVSGGFSLPLTLKGLRLHVEIGCYIIFT